MKTLNTTLKFVAISAAALTLVACGGGGGGSSVSAPADPRVYVTSHPDVISKFSDVAAAHRDGWSGQNTDILSTASVDSLVKKIAPSADFGSNYNVTFNFQNAAGAIDSTQHGGVLMTERHNPNFDNVVSARFKAGYTTATATLVGIAVKNDNVSAGSVRADISATQVSNGVNFTFKATPTDVEITKTFTTISGVTVGAITTQADRSAYLLGSASIIQSKFASTGPADIVRIMDQNRVGNAVTGAFSLSNSLAPKAIVR